jgi:putative methionine-R-sulfoxide reductase with GAF domain
LHNASGTIIGVLDVDSDSLSDFDETDAVFLGKLAQHITELYERAALA